ncbi:tyrosine-type recombinase/integrase [Desulfofundulus thermocisternus]|uniref:tyrosine-type recombinase/integrase n=1 Tax=Desulfofundulus thermocisternus TaxID=42471 RepID=UPI00217DE862|nr:tyrosine-type recombinase/integrase [Desulfofundulus thermocisternus]MCS5696944.1 tyrosine-type recombinase/integrase [Desulfofundulus thermocisternus]
MFTEYLSEKSAEISPDTVRVYRTDLMDFANWFERENGQQLAPELVTSFDLRGYLSHLQEDRSLKPGTISRRMRTVRGWLKWAGQDVRFPKPPREQKRAPKCLEKVEQHRLLRAVERYGTKRDMALFRVMLSCGLRVGEAVSLKVSDLDIGKRHGYLTVTRGKRNKRRTVPVPPEARHAIREWLEEHNGSEWLFPGRFNGHLTERAVRKLAKKYAQLAGLNAGVKVHPHILRHTCAMNLIRAGHDISTVAAVLGHENITTTAIYTMPTEKDLARALEGAEV